jgi:hypothetical protein
MQKCTSSLFNVSSPPLSSARGHCQPRLPLIKLTEPSTEAIEFHRGRPPSRPPRSSPDLIDAFLQSPPVRIEPTPPIDSTLSQRRQGLHAEPALPWGSTTRSPPRHPRHLPHQGRRRGAPCSSHVPRQGRRHPLIGVVARPRGSSCEIGAVRTELAVALSMRVGARGGTRREWELRTALRVGRRVVASSGPSAAARLYPSATAHLCLRGRPSVSSEASCPPDAIFVKIGGKLPARGHRSPARSRRRAAWGRTGPRHH